MMDNQTHFIGPEDDPFGVMSPISWGYRSLTQIPFCKILFWRVQKPLHKVTPVTMCVHCYCSLLWYQTILVMCFVCFTWCTCDSFRGPTFLHFGENCSAKWPAAFCYSVLDVAPEREWKALFNQLWVILWKWKWTLGRHQTRWICGFPCLVIPQCFHIVREHGDVSHYLCWPGSPFLTCILCELELVWIRSDSWGNREQQLFPRVQTWTTLTRQAICGWGAFNFV